jgi:enoyl-CoA hydratase
MSRPEDIVLFKTEGKIAHIILNRPENLNAFTADTPFLIRNAVERANADPNVHVRLMNDN